SQPGAQGQPLYSYSKRTYTGNTLGTQSKLTGTLQFWGKLSSLMINVTTPYTGTLSTLNFGAMAAFYNYPTINADSSVFSYGPGINLKIAGQRVIKPSGVTGSQNGDSGLSVPAAVWFTQGAGIG